MHRALAIVLSAVVLAACETASDEETALKVQAEVERHRATLLLVLTDLDEQQDRLDELRSDVDNLHNQMGGLRSDVDDVRDHVDELQDQIECIISEAEYLVADGYLEC